VRHHAELPPGVYDVPAAVDDEVARRKLSSMGLAIDRLSEVQTRYLDSWEHGS
jgi:adenosylhomocysteinase